MGCAGSASTRARTRSRCEALTPVATEAGPVALPIDWEAVSWLWALDGYPSDPAHAEFTGKSCAGNADLEGRAAAPTTRRRPRRPPRARRREFLDAVAARLRDFSAANGRRGLLVFAIDTELLGHWWSEGAVWLRAVLAGAEAAGVRLLHARRRRSPSTSRSSARLRPRPGARARTCAPGTRRPSPTSPGARGGWSCACCARSSAGLRRPAAARAARELLAVAGERLGLPRQARRGGRLRLPARHRPRRSDARGHRLPGRHRPAHAVARPGPESRSPAGALSPRHR